MNFKQNPTLWIGLAIPVLMIIFIAASIYVPQLFAEPPQHNFVYAVNPGGYYGTEYIYTVKDNQLTRQETPQYKDNERPLPVDAIRGDATFFVHDVASNTSREISFEEVSKLKLNPSAQAPDGYEIKRGGQGGGVFPIFYDGGDYNSQYLSKGAYSQKLELQRLSGADYYAFQFMGWIITD